MNEIRHQLDSAYTVRNLRDALEGLPDDAPVLFVCDYGDYHHTQQALPVGEHLEVYTSDLGESAYSNSGICLLEDREPDDEPREDEEEAGPVLILRS